jgi:hypothetical protein
VRDRAVAERDLAVVFVRTRVAFERPRFNRGYMLIEDMSLPWAMAVTIVDA